MKIIPAYQVWLGEQMIKEDRDLSVIHEAYKAIVDMQAPLNALAEKCFSEGGWINWEGVSPVIRTRIAEIVPDEKRGEL